ncbi:MAG: peptidoglycan-binding domain-containing protein [Paracoccaceae bacterium]
MIRRAFLLSLASLALAPALGAQEAAPFNAVALRRAFDALPAASRKKAQEELQIAGLYHGALDGRYGPGTERALAAGAGFIAFNSRNTVVPDLLTDAGIAAFLGALGTGGMAAYLYGEGDECDNC